MSQLRATSFSKIGDNCLHGSHHGAHRSTNTGSLDESLIRPKSVSSASTIHGNDARHLAHRGRPAATAGTRLRAPQPGQALMREFILSSAAHVRAGHAQADSHFKDARPHLERPWTSAPVQGYPTAVGGQHPAGDIPWATTHSFQRVETRTSETGTSRRRRSPCQERPIHRRRRPTPRREQPPLRNAPRPPDQRQRPHLGPRQQQGPNRNHRRWQGFEPVRGVETKGLEPSTSTLQRSCAASCATSPRFEPGRS